MIHETTGIGPWLDLDEIALVENVIEDDCVRVTLRSGNECVFNATTDQIRRLVAAWMTANHRRDTDEMDRRKALS